MLITTVFATMNRSATAVACVRALAAQTRSPDRVIVADNASSDTTVADLQCLTSLPFPLDVLPMPENLGNAGGVKAAMELAFEEGSDAVWILDDDSWPRSDALEKLLEHPWSDTEVIHPIQIDPNTKDLTWPMQVCDPTSGWSTVDSLRDIGNQTILVTRNNWTGSIVSRRVREKVGPVMGELFIRGEDEEYPWRFQQAGVSQRAVVASILDHPGPESLTRTAFLGKTIYFEPGLSDWKLYYKVRNMVWLQRCKRGLPAALLHFLAYLIIVSRHDGPQRIPLLLEAVTDALRSHLGRWHKQ
jgi:rhamnopyranosyl-N-acetylglucosaminyl-diphospho-decaprenol beta-1,3/1,4-galactofuranosyltransferase